MFVLPGFDLGTFSKYISYILSQLRDFSNIFSLISRIFFPDHINMCHSFFEFILSFSMAGYRFDNICPHQI